MQKIFFFRRKNPATGEVLSDYVDADERTAWSYFKNSRHFQYVGWSSGQHMIDLKKQRMSVDKDERTGMPVPLSEEKRTTIQEAVQREIDEAENNPDKTPPRDLTRMVMGDKMSPQQKQAVQSRLNQMP